ncbi:MAG: hypothetical protein B7Y48_03660 [Methylophilales bacterium 28-44-11]|nr:MAG: hypothetical protein B7Y48_03660 [Methylophilales bacterium 28-44-11]OYZ08986.1 MAG: hypothetical protein B7Y32_01850 [Methylophilales bacterium 16-45-7]
MNEQKNSQSESDTLGSWWKSIKLGLLALLLFMLACLVYGWFNAFSFWHAYADAGMNSSIAHALYYGVFMGPVIVIVVTLMAGFAKKK